MLSTDTPTAFLLADQFIRGATPARGTHYAAFAVSRGDDVLFRVTCLACGASAQGIAPEPAVGGAPGPVGLALAGWAEAYADGHDAGVCLDTFSAESRANVGDLLVGRVQEQLGLPEARAFLEQIAMKTQEPENRDWVLLGSPGMEPVILDGSSAAFEVGFARGGPAFGAHVVALEEARQQLRTRQPLAAVSLQGYDLGVGVLRWYLMLPDRLIPFATKATAADLEVMLLNDQYVREIDDGPFPLNPGRVVRAGALAAVTP